eukprot:jgi/Psemu1/67500/estExt_Genemark1.C_3280044
MLGLASAASASVSVSVVLAIVFVIPTTTTIAINMNVNMNTNTNTNTDPESTENLKPWLDRWNNRRIGFHLKSVNPILLAHADKLLGGVSVSSSSEEEEGTCTNANANATPDDRRIFVPLCGKAIDVAYLASRSCSDEEQRVHVVGLEGIRVALQEFADEHPELEIRAVRDGDGNGDSSAPPAWERFEGKTVSLWKGDYFGLGGNGSDPPPPFPVGTFDAIYDRAAIVAIDPSLRPAYVKILDQLLKPGGGILMVTLERKTTIDEARNRGPPFSIPEATIRQLFDSAGLLDDSNNNNNNNNKLFLRGDDPGPDRSAGDQSPGQGAIPGPRSIAGNERLYNADISTICDFKNHAATSTSTSTSTSTATATTCLQHAFNIKQPWYHGNDNTGAIQSLEDQGLAELRRKHGRSLDDETDLTNTSARRQAGDGGDSDIFRMQDMNNNSDKGENEDRNKGSRKIT